MSFSPETSCDDDLSSGLPRVKNMAVTSTSKGLELNYHSFNAQE